MNEKAENKKLEPRDLPVDLRVTKCTNDIRYAAQVAATKYDLPGSILELILDSITLESKRAAITRDTEQMYYMAFGEEEQSDEGVDEDVDN